MILFLFIVKNIAINQCYRYILDVFCLVFGLAKKAILSFGGKTAFNDFNFYLFFKT